jgi:RND family efflux transporter MFP subunit
MKTIHVALAIMAVLTVTSCKHKNTTARTEPVRVKTVCVAQNESLTDGTGYPGTIEAGEETPLSFQVAGTVNNVNVKVGDKISKGQTIATLDATSLQHAYDISAAAEEQANDAYRRMKMLHDQKALAEIKWVEVQSAVKQARSATAIARKALSDAKLKAPYSGVVSAKFADKGQTVAPFEPIVNIMTTSDVKASVSVPENSIASIAVGDKGTVECAGHTYSSTVSEKGVSANPLTRNYTVKLSIEGRVPADSLLPGMICRVKIQTAGSDSMPSIVLPMDAVLLSEDNSNFVWLIENGIAQRRAISIGDMTDNGVTVTEGLARGDSVIVSGQQKVSEGMKVISIN